MKRIVLHFFLFFIPLSACKKSGEPSPIIPPPSPKVPYAADNSFKIVAYFPSYRNPDSVDISKYKMITHLFYTFLTPTANGGLNPLPESARFNQVIANAQSSLIPMVVIPCLKQQMIH